MSRGPPPGMIRGGKPPGMSRGMSNEEGPPPNMASFGAMLPAPGGPPPGMPSTQGMMQKSAEESKMAASLASPV